MINGEERNKKEICHWSEAWQSRRLYIERDEIASSFLLAMT
jgi:hypothetical protein